MAREVKVRLELGIGEAHHVAKAIDAYIKSGVYGSSLPSWREVRDKVRNALHKVALESEYGGSARGNPDKLVHATRVKVALKRALSALDQAKVDVKGGRIEKGTVRAMEAYAHAINTMRELEDAGVKKIGPTWERAIRVGRASAAIVRKVARQARERGGVKKAAKKPLKAKPKKPPAKRKLTKPKPRKPPAKRQLTRAETRRRMMEENPSKDAAAEAAAKVKREIARL